MTLRRPDLRGGARTASRTGRGMRAESWNVRARIGATSEKRGVEVEEGCPGGQPLLQLRPHRELRGAEPQRHSESAGGTTKLYDGTIFAVCGEGVAAFCLAALASAPRWTAGPTAEHAGHEDSKPTRASVPSRKHGPSLAARCLSPCATASSSASHAKCAERRRSKPTTRTTHAHWTFDGCAGSTTGQRTGR